MNDTYYLLDNNVVGKLTRSQRRSEFLLERCRVPDDVIHEAGPDRRAELEELRYPTTAAVLQALKAVLATEPPGNTALVDLYHNKGNADPFLVACALVEQVMGADMLVAPEWVVVTDDKAVRSKAAECGVPWISHLDFVLLIPDRA